MTTKAKATNEVPEIPEGFVLNEIDHNVAYRDAGRFVKRNGASVSSSERSARSARAAAWECAGAGGSAVGWQRDLDRLRHEKSRAQGRLGAHRARGNAAGAAEAEAEIASIDKGIAEKESLIAAISEGDRRDYRRELEVARARLEVASAEVDRFRRAGIAAPRELEDRYAAGQSAYAKADTAFRERAARLAGLSQEMQKHVGAAMAARAREVETLIAACAASVKAAIQRGGEVLAHFPARLMEDGEAVKAIRVAIEGAAILDRLTGRVGGGVAAFSEALGKTDAEIVREVLDGSRGRPGAMALRRAASV